VISDPFNLDRFSDAQYPIFSQVKRELSEGRKQTHWMWFVFPQLRLLGRSQTAQYFGITSLAEARAYMQHSLLGQRLIDCTKLVNSIESRSAYEIFDSPDDMKFRSSMTLFAAAVPEVTEFGNALSNYFNGTPDARTLRLLAPDN
jgi:uncharacterized protein (DUF1810 family)